MTIKKEGHPDITVHICQPALSDKKKTLEITETEQNPTHTLTITKDAGIKNVLWYSASPDVATVDQTGKVTAVAKGKANITDYVYGCAYNCTITVKETAVARIRTLHVNTDTSKTISVKGI
ncbi:MAG: Ig-like domain-containing protein, partial [Lachnospiraceae bacterium]|nr:Ig-like domain-containing protein [Lachnospiraceae bacterium]